MAKAYRLTKSQWLALPDKVKAKFPDCGAGWYNSNYHLCACIQAIQTGERLKAEVYNSYSEWTRKHSFDNHIKCQAKIPRYVRNGIVRVCDLIR